MKHVYLRDIPFGILLLIVSIYAMLGASFLSGVHDTLTLTGVVICVLVADKLLNLAIKLIMGIEVKIK